jgi:hypothetical protein
MQTRKPLRRKTPLKKHSGGFAKPQKGLAKGGKIRARSKRREREGREYGRLRKEFLAANPHCSVFPTEMATEVHHRKGRGRFYLDVSTWLSVSDAGHRFLHDNPAIAREKGWLVYGKDGK